MLKGDNLEVVLVGHTHIARSSVTTSTFESLPDVPITSVSVDLPTGPNSALAPNGRLCGSKLLAPTTIIAQNGAKLTPTTKLTVSGCPVLLLSHKRKGSHLIVRIWAPRSGRVSISLPGTAAMHKRVRGEGDMTVAVPINGAAGKHKVTAHVTFTPTAGNRSALKFAVRE